METTDTTINPEWKKTVNKLAETSLHFKLVKMLMDKGLKYPLPQKFDLESYYDGGVIRKSDLENYAHYIGLSRSGNIAIWDPNDERFVCIRYKFSSAFVERTKHIEDDDGYDVFVPLKKVGVDVVETG